MAMHYVYNTGAFGATGGEFRGTGLVIIVLLFETIIGGVVWQLFDGGVLGL